MTIKNNDDCIEKKKRVKSKCGVDESVDPKIDSLGK